VAVQDRSAGSGGSESVRVLPVPIPPVYHNASVWWRRRESNPRPRAPGRSIYKLSRRFSSRSPAPRRPDPVRQSRGVSGAVCRDKPTAPQSVDRRHDPGYGPTGRDGRLIRQPAREYCSRQLCCSGSLTRPPDLGLLLRPRIHPCRDHIAPMSMTRGHVHSECTTRRPRPSHSSISGRRATRAPGPSRHVLTFQQERRPRVPEACAVAVDLMCRPICRRVSRAA